MRFTIKQFATAVLLLALFGSQLQANPREMSKWTLGGTFNSKKDMEELMKSGGTFVPVQVAALDLKELAFHTGQGALKASLLNDCIREVRGLQASDLEYLPRLIIGAASKSQQFRHTGQAALSNRRTLRQPQTHHGPTACSRSVKPAHSDAYARTASSNKGESRPCRLLA